MNENDFVLGQHERAIEELSHDVKDIKGAVARIEAALSEKRGADRLRLFLLTAGSGMVGSLITVGTKLLHR